MHAYQVSYETKGCKKVGNGTANNIMLLCNNKLAMLSRSQPTIASDTVNRISLASQGSINRLHRLKATNAVNAAASSTQSSHLYSSPSSNTAHRALRKARSGGTIKLPVAIKYVKPTDHCQGVSEVITDVERWISTGVDAHSRFKTSNTNADRKLRGYKVVHKYNKATDGIARIRRCEPCVGLPPDYDRITRKAFKDDVVDFAGRYETPVSPVATIDAVDPNCSTSIIEWNNFK